MSNTADIFNMESSQYLATHQENEKLLCTAGNSLVKEDFLDVHLDTPDPEYITLNSLHAMLSPRD